MGRYILLNETDGGAETALALIATMPSVAVVDRTDDRALLVEASPEQAEALGGKLTGWKVRPETSHGRSDPPFPRARWKL